ncbi:MAG: hypothetical protein ABI083_10830 [Lapillicoccus sp.]
MAISAVPWMSSFALLALTGASSGWWLPLHSGVPAAVLTTLGLREIRCLS